MNSFSSINNMMVSFISVQLIIQILKSVPLGMLTANAQTSSTEAVNNNNKVTVFWQIL